MSGKSDRSTTLSSSRWRGRTMAKPKNLARNRRGDLGQWEQELASIFSTSGSPFLKPNETATTKQECMKRLLQINNATTVDDLAQLELKHVLWASLGIYCFFKLNLTRPQKGMGKWMRRRNYERSKRLYADLMEKIFSAEIEEDIVLYILDFLTEFRLWRYEHLCIDVLDTPMKSGGTGAALLGDMMDRLESLGGRNEQEARHILRVLYDVLNVFFWPSLDASAAKAITRLLKMYRTAVRVEYEQELVSPVAAGSYTRKGLEVCIRRIIEHMQNSDLMLIVGYMVEWVFDRKLGDETILDFGTVLEHAAIVHQSETFKLTFTHQLFDSLFEIVSSERRVVSHLGNRILHQLLDRHDNRLQFETPKIFFQNTHFNINVVECIPDDKDFLKKHRPKIHESIMRAIIKHAMHRVNLESIYTTICLLATEVPSGYTAAALANLVMNIQEAARNHTGYRSQVQYHLHAMVLAVLSLLCWLHNAPDFYKYVNKIMNLRAEQAPHLNPPLRIAYMFAQHHVLWDKPELFFDDWEVRYSLWMRFKIKDTETFLKKRKAAAPPMKEELEEAANMDPSLSAHVPKLTRRQQLEPYLPVRDPITELDERWLREQEEKINSGVELGSTSSESSSSGKSSGKEKSVKLFLGKGKGSKYDRGSKGIKGSKAGKESKASTDSKGMGIIKLSRGGKEKSSVSKDGRESEATKQSGESSRSAGSAGSTSSKSSKLSRAEKREQKKTEKKEKKNNDRKGKSVSKRQDRERKKSKGSSSSSENEAGDKKGSQNTGSKVDDKLAKKSSRGTVDKTDKSNKTQQKQNQSGSEKTKTRSLFPNDKISDKRRENRRKPSFLAFRHKRSSQYLIGQGSASLPNLDSEHEEPEKQERGKARASITWVSDKDKPPESPKADDTLKAIPSAAQSPFNPITSQSKSAPASATTTQPRRVQDNQISPTQPPIGTAVTAQSPFNPITSQSKIGPASATTTPRRVQDNQISPTQPPTGRAVTPPGKPLLPSPSLQGRQEKPTRSQSTVFQSLPLKPQQETPSSNVQSTAIKPTTSVSKSVPPSKPPIPSTVQPVQPSVSKTLPPNNKPHAISPSPNVPESHVMSTEMLTGKSPMLTASPSKQGRQVNQIPPSDSKTLPPPSKHPVSSLSPINQISSQVQYNQPPAGKSPSPFNRPVSSTSPGDQESHIKQIKSPEIKTLPPSGKPIVPSPSSPEQGSQIKSTQPPVQISPPPNNHPVSSTTRSIQDSQAKPVPVINVESPTSKSLQPSPSPSVQGGQLKSAQPTASKTLPSSAPSASPSVQGSQVKPIPPSVSKTLSVPGKTPVPFPNGQGSQVKSTQPPGITSSPYKRRAPSTTPSMQGNQVKPASVASVGPPTSKSLQPSPSPSAQDGQHKSAQPTASKTLPSSAPSASPSGQGSQVKSTQPPGITSSPYKRRASSTTPSMQGNQVKAAPVASVGPPTSKSLQPSPSPSVQGRQLTSAQPTASKTLPPPAQSVSPNAQSRKVKPAPVTSVVPPTSKSPHLSPSPSTQGGQSLLRISPVPSPTPSRQGSPRSPISNVLTPYKPTLNASRVEVGQVKQIPGGRILPFSPISSPTLSAQSSRGEKYVPSPINLQVPTSSARKVLSPSPMTPNTSDNRMKLARPSPRRTASPVRGRPIPSSATASRSISTANTRGQNENRPPNITDKQPVGRKVSVSASAPIASVKHVAETRIAPIITFQPPSPSVSTTPDVSSASSLNKKKSQLRKVTMSYQKSPQKRSLSVPGQVRTVQVSTANAKTGTAGVRRGSTPHKRHLQATPAQRRLSVSADKTRSNASVGSYRGFGSFYSEESAEMTSTMTSQSSSQSSTAKKEKRSDHSNTSSNNFKKNNTGWSTSPIENSKSFQRFQNAIEIRHGGSPSHTPNRKPTNIAPRTTKNPISVTGTNKQGGITPRASKPPMRNHNRAPTPANIRKTVHSANKMTSPIELASNRQSFITSVTGSPNHSNKERDGGRPTTR